MKILITNKKKLFIVLSVILLIVVTIVGVTYFRTQSVSGSNRELPIYCVETPKKQVAISFDAAWGNEDTDQIINILKKYNVKATFFLVGSWVDKYPQDVKKLAASGHTIGNHSDTHPYLSSITEEEIRGEISSCNQKIKKLTGSSPLLIRPPYGDYDNKVINTVKSMNMYCIQWDVDSLDWQGISAEQITQNVLTKVKNGSIVLFHNAADHTPEALPKIIETLQSEGYEFVSIDSLIYKDNFYIDVTGKQIKKS